MARGLLFLVREVIAVADDHEMCVCRVERKIWNTCLCAGCSVEKKCAARGGLTSAINSPRTRGNGRAASFRNFKHRRAVSV